MHILVLHRIPYCKINYHQGIDHECHTVTYMGTATSLTNIPTTLRARKVERPGKKSVADEVILWMSTEKEHFDLVISMSEYELIDAARIRAFFNIPGALPHQVEKVRNKVVMKQAVAAAGLDVPQFMSLNEFVTSKTHPWLAKTVLKPVDGASSEDVYVFDSAAQLMTAIANQCTTSTRLDRNNPELGKFEVEEFIEGPILHFDGLVNAGHILVAKASRYIGTCLAYVRGEPLGSYQIPLDVKTKNWISKSLHAVGIQQGSFHLEAIDSHGGLVFLEVANRVGGADVVDTFEMATGIHLPSAELKILLGEKIDILQRIRTERYFGWFVFPGHHLDGTYCRLTNVEPFIRSLVMVRWQQLAPDRPLPRNITYQSTEVPAAGIVSATSSEALAEFLDQMFSRIQVVSIEAAEAA